MRGDAGFQDRARLVERFVTPPKEYSPAPAWWWSGDKLERNRLRWEMEQLAAGGVYNVIITHLAATGPYGASAADAPAAFSPEWWELVQAVCRDAEEIGMRIWFYDQIGFASANLQERLVADNAAYSGWQLRSVAVEGEGALSLALPESGELLLATGTPLDAAGEVAGHPAPLPAGATGAQGELPGRWRLRLVYTVRTGFNYLHAEACRRLLDLTHGEIERHVGRFFGVVVAGTFQDELPAMPGWTADFAAEFRRRKGYDITLLLAYLWEGDHPAAWRIRVDYQQVRAALAEECFFRPLHAWHESNGLVCGFDQMGGARTGRPIDGVALYADYLSTHRWYSAPGSDHHGEAKAHSSLAHIYNRPRVWIEGFHSSGWGGTLEETFDWLLPWLRAGATLYNPHAVYYSTRGGWWEWAPPSTCWRQPYWRHYKVFADAISRLCCLFSSGVHVCDIAVLSPVACAQAGWAQDKILRVAAKAQETYRALVGSMVWERMSPGVLDRACRDFDCIDEVALQRGSSIDGALVVAGERYRVIILPACQVLAAASIVALCDFVENGGLLIAVGDLPSLAIGGDESHLAQLHNLFRAGKAHQVATPGDVTGLLAGIAQTVQAPVPTLHRRVGHYHLLLVPAAYPRATQHASEGNPRFLPYTFDPDAYAKTLRIRLRGGARDVELWNVLTGKREPLTVAEVDGCQEIEVSFAGGPAAVVVWQDVDGVADARGCSVAGTSRAERCAAGTVSRAIPLGPVWECIVEPTMDNRYGDFSKPATAGAPPVSTWSFDHLVEAAGEDGIASGWHMGADDNWCKAAAAHATFGVYAWAKGPCPVAELPEPLPGLPAIPPALADADWQPVVYSLSRGIYHDEIHSYFGPRGHVPEEFLDFGAVDAGTGVQLRTTVHCTEAGDYWLCIGAPAAKSCWVNGRFHTEDSAGYLWMTKVELAAGCNLIEFRLIAEENVRLRGHWALVEQPERYARPELVAAAGGASRGADIRFRRELELPWEPASAQVSITTDLECHLYVNGRHIAVQGGFTPWSDLTRTQSYNVDAFRRGGNSIVVEMRDPGRPVALTVDAMVHGASGETFTFTSDAGWVYERAGEEPRPCRLRRRQWEIRLNSGVCVDPAWCHLWRRPHPLPAAAWLEDEPADGSVIQATPDAYPGANRVEWFRWRLPPGAVKMNVPAQGSWRLWVNGAPLSASGADVDLPDPLSGRMAVLRVETAPGCVAGAVWSGPVAYTMGTGLIQAGDWTKQGLAGYSGGVRYRTRFRMPDGEFKHVELDLGKVRGTVEAWVNGRHAGTCIWSPYRLDVTDLIHTGENEIEVLVCNTLAPYLSAVSPTPYVLPGQEASGLFGPVRVIMEGLNCG